MNAATIVSRDGDTLSAIAYEYYGSSAGQVERILVLNPGLARLPAVLPAGVAVVMPPYAAEKIKTVATVNLWD